MTCARPKNACTLIFKIIDAEDNYTAVLQRLCWDVLCNKTSGTMYDFTNVCDTLITCPLEAERNYQITEKVHVNNKAPTVSSYLKCH